MTVWVFVLFVLFVLQGDVTVSGQWHEPAMSTFATWAECDRARDVANLLKEPFEQVSSCREELKQ